MHVGIFTASCGSNFLSLSFDTAKVQQFFRMTKYFENYFLIFFTAVFRISVVSVISVSVLFLEVEIVVTIILYYILYNII